MAELVSRCRDSIRMVPIADKLSFRCGKPKDHLSRKHTAEWTADRVLTDGTRVRVPVTISWPDN